MKNVFGVIISILTAFFLSSCQSQPALGLNEEASLPETAELPENPLLLHAMTSSIHPGDSTMSTLYGNDVAFDYAGGHGDNHYPDGAVLYEVTWSQQSDQQWVGAKIPKKIVMIERVTFVKDGDVAYEVYEGDPLKKVGSANGDNTRKSAICGQRMAVAP
jgi:hypothetical protein